MKTAKRKQPKDINSLSEVQSVRQHVQSSKQNLPRLLRWAQCISAHPHLYNPSIGEYKTYRYFRIILQSLKDLEIPSIRRRTFIQFSCILYDLSTSSYVGHTYFSEMFQIESRPTQKATLHCNKSMYLYTELENAVIKVDTWILQADKNKNNFEVMAKRAFLGSFTIDITHSNDSGRIDKELNKREEDRFFEIGLDDEQGQKSQIRQRNHSTIVYQVLNTHSLTYLHLFVPPNVICDQNDRILGLKNGHISPDGQIASDERSKLRFQLHEIVIPRAIIKSLAESVEQQIILSNEVVGRPMNALKEMILHLQFHNGWKSVSQQTIVLKDIPDQSMMLSKQVIEASTANLKRKSKMTESTPKSYVYGVEKMRELNAVYLCQGGAFLMWLEAKIEFKFDIKIDEQKKTKSEIVFVPVGFTVRSLDDRQQQIQESIEWFPGNPYNLEHLLQFLTTLRQQKKTNVQSQNKMTCQMMFYLIKSKGGLDSIDKNTLEKDTQQIQSLKAEKQRLVRMRRKIKEEKRKKLIEINQEIPFLDPTKLKEELYLQKIEKIRSEKQEKEDILFYLKAKVNQLQRQALSFNYNRNTENQHNLQGSRTRLVQKLPEYFIDYKPQETPVDLNEGVSIDVFNAAYCRKAQKAPSTAEKALVSQFMDAKTYLNLKIAKFQSLREEVNEFTIFLNDFSGRQHRLGPLNSTYHQMEHQSINILVTQQSPEFTSLVLNSLINSFLPMYIQCGPFGKLVGVAFIDAEQLLEQVQLSSICLPSTKVLVTFKQDQTQLAQLELILSFTQSVAQENQPKLSDLQQNLSMEMSELIRGKEYSMISRINRYKQQTTMVSSVKAELIQKVLSSVKVEKVRINYNRGISQVIKLKVANNSSLPKVLNLKLFDPDQQYLRQPQAKVIYKSTDSRVADRLQMVSFNSGNVIELKPNCTQVLVLEYYSGRKALNSVSPFFSLGNNLNLPMGTYNHKHKITVTLTQLDHNLVYQIYEIEVIPIIEPNTLYLEAFISEKTKIILPIPSKQLELEQPSPSFALTPTRAIIAAQLPTTSQSSLLQLHLLKHNPLNNHKLSFQNIQLYINACARHSLECRLWQRQDVMLTVPLQAILKKEIELNYPIQSLKVESKHIDFKLRAKDECSYSVDMGFNRKKNEVFIRGRVEPNAIGKQIYPVQISDQCGTVIHRICITNDVAFPTLTPDKIINIKIPKQNLDQDEQFSYKNLSEQGSIFYTKSLKPQLMKIKERAFQMKTGQTIELSLQFDWTAIREYLQAQERDECQLLMGVVGTHIIDYILLRCRA